MADIDPKQIRELRDKTGMGVSACKKALEDAQGDLEKAEVALRKMGIDKAAKKADRPTGEGVVAIKLAADGRRAVLLEMNCEQEPTTKNERFLAFVDKVLGAVLASGAADAEAALGLAVDGKPLREHLTDLVAVSSENMQLKRVAVLAAPAGGLIGRYVHFNKKAGGLCALSVEGAASDALQTAANDICMHAVAARPLALDRTSVPAAVIEKEKEVFREEVKSKPAAIQEKILEGKLGKFFQEKCLLEQLFVKDPEGKTTVQQMLDAAGKAAGAKVACVAFVRFELGL